jgi:hypothetical protein
MLIYSSVSLRMIHRNHWARTHKLPNLGYLGILLLLCLQSFIRNDAWMCHKIIVVVVVVVARCRNASLMMPFVALKPSRYQETSFKHLRKESPIMAAETVCCQCSHGQIMNPTSWCVGDLSIYSPWQHQLISHLCELPQLICLARCLPHPREARNSQSLPAI